MAWHSVLSERYFPRNSVRLGRLVADKANPEDSYHDALPADEEWDCDCKENSNFSAGSDSNRDTGFRQKLLHYVSLGYSKRSSYKSSVSADCVRTYQLLNSTEYFMKIIKQQKTQKWIETTLKEGSRVFLIVGFKTILDAEITEFDKKFRKADLQVTASGAGLGADGLNVGVEVSAERSAAVRSKYKTGGEQVCALRYRKLKFSTFKRKDLGPTLKTSQWEILDNTRQAHITETDNVLEAEIGESEESENFDSDSDDEKWTKMEDEEGDFYV